MAGVYAVEFVVISREIPAAPAVVPPSVVPPAVVPPAVVPSALFIQQEQREIRNNLPGKKHISSNKLKFKYLSQFRKFSSFFFSKSSNTYYCKKFVSNLST